jgi:3-oxoacyl-[acyl-carrier protein] reductase
MTTPACPSPQHSHLLQLQAPGWVATKMSAAALNHPETSKQVMSLIPLGRPAHVDEIAGPILFLCTPLAGFISGEIFNVNGGAVLVG